MKKSWTVVYKNKDFKLLGSTQEIYDWDQAVRGYNDLKNFYKNNQDIKVLLIEKSYNEYEIDPNKCNNCNFYNPSCSHCIGC